MRFGFQQFHIVVVGCSAGGLEALSSFLSSLSPELGAAVAVVQHLSPLADDFLVRHLKVQTLLPVVEAADKMPMEPGQVYVAPPNYHLLVERDRTFSLSLEGRVSFARPSIDVLFESAARAFGAGSIGIILTGANRDGSDGCRLIRAKGGIVLVQDPETAEHRTMPEAALRGSANAVMALEALAEEVNRLTSVNPLDGTER